MDVIYTFNTSQVLELHSLYQQEWWTKKRSITDTIKGIEGSQICIGLIDNRGCLQGFARVLTDYIFKALIFDLIVAKEYRSKGLGNKLISLIKNHIELQEVNDFELYCLSEVYDFYEKHGFKRDVGNVQLMRYTKA